MLKPEYHYRGTERTKSLRLLILLPVFFVVRAFFYNFAPNVYIYMSRVDENLSNENVDINENEYADGNS